ncbi:hypothetical protein K1W54_42820, partial [Micromonospora sp. CPCC 205371]|nr:hypothetical protein [Micromonospora sp. CPCC 205371]
MGPRPIPPRAPEPIPPRAPEPIAPQGPEPIAPQAPEPIPPQPVTPDQLPPELPVPREEAGSGGLPDGVLPGGPGAGTAPQPAVPGGPEAAPPGAPRGPAPGAPAEVPPRTLPDASSLPMRLPDVVVPLQAVPLATDPAQPPVPRPSSGPALPLQVTPAVPRDIVEPAGVEPQQPPAPAGPPGVPAVPRHGAPASPVVQPAGPPPDRDPHRRRMPERGSGSPNGLIVIDLPDEVLPHKDEGGTGAPDGDDPSPRPPDDGKPGGQARRAAGTARDRGSRPGGGTTPNGTGTSRGDASPGGRVAPEGGGASPGRVEVRPAEPGQATQQVGPSSGGVGTITSALSPGSTTGAGRLLAEFARQEEELAARNRAGGPGALRVPDNEELVEAEREHDQQLLDAADPEPLPPELTPAETIDEAPAGGRSWRVDAPAWVPSRHSPESPAREAPAAEAQTVHSGAGAETLAGGGPLPVGQPPTSLVASTPPAGGAPPSSPATAAAAPGGPPPQPAAARRPPRAVPALSRVVA